MTNLTGPILHFKKEWGFRELTMISTETLKVAISERLKKRLPDRTKRYILLTSLLKHISKDLNRESVHKLNEVMSLSSSDNALMFPIQISKVIWRGKVSQISLDNLDQADAVDTLARQLTDMIPNCLQYSTYQTMYEDIKKLLVNKPTLAV